MAKSNVPDRILVKLERHNPHLSGAVRDVRAASEERSIAAAEILMAAHFYLTPGLAHRLNFTQQEETAMANLAKGKGYEAAPSEAEKKGGG